MALSHNPSLHDVAVTTAAGIGIDSIEKLAFAICFFLVTTILINTIWKNVMRETLVAAAAFALCFLLFMAWEIVKVSEEGEFNQPPAQQVQLAQELP